MFAQPYSCEIPQSACYTEGKLNHSLRMESLLYSFLAGISSVLGAVVVMFLGIPGKKLLPALLGFASGVMTYVTIDELIPIAHEYCTLTHKHVVSTGLLVGMIVAQLLSLVLNI